MVVGFPQCRAVAELGLPGAAWGGLRWRVVAGGVVVPGCQAGSAARVAWPVVMALSRLWTVAVNGDFGLCVELDGMQAHPEHQRWDDVRRTNAITARGITTLRYGWIDVDRRSCLTAAQIGAVLRSRGWPGPLTPCRKSCPVGG